MERVGWNLPTRRFTPHCCGANTIGKPTFRTSQPLSVLRYQCVGHQSFWRHLLRFGPPRYWKSSQKTQIRFDFPHRCWCAMGTRWSAGSTWKPGRNASCFWRESNSLQKTIHQIKRQRVLPIGTGPKNRVGFGKGPAARIYFIWFYRNLSPSNELGYLALSIFHT